MSGVGGARPVQVAFVAPTLHRGGAERQMLMITRALQGQGFAVRFLLLAERGSLASEAESLGATVELLGVGRHAGGLAPLRAGPDLARAIAAYRRLTRDVDVVDAWLPPAYTFAGLARPVAPVPVLIAGRRSILDVHQTRTWYRRWGAAMSMRRVDAVVANSRVAADQAVSIEGVPADRVHVVHNAVELPPTSAADRLEHRARWGAAETDIVVGLVGNFLPGKGQFLLLSAAERLAPEGLPLRFVLVGGGALRDSFRAAVEQRGLAGVVVLEGPEVDAHRLYCGFDIYVQGSDSEGLPNAVLEAAAAGVAVAATDVGGTSEVIRDGVDGLLTPKGDPDALADAIRSLASDADRRSRFGASARARAGEFSLERLGAETADVYWRYLARARRGGR